MSKAEKKWEPLAETWYTMSKAAKLIKLMGRNNLYKLLRDNGVLMRQNEPYQVYCDNGYFKLEQVPKYNLNGKLFKYFPVLFVSSRGIDFILQLLKEKETQRN